MLRKMRMHHLARRAFRLSNHIWLSPQLKFASLGVAAFFGLNVGIQKSYGTANNWFSHEFKVKASAADLSDFYGSEDFMQIFCLFKFVEHYMMRNSTFDEEGKVHNPMVGVPGEMLVTMRFRGRVENVDTMDDEDDEEISYFEKKEHFMHYIRMFGFLTMTIWDQYQRFGFYELEDGTCECFHEGVSFSGPWPVRVLFTLHAKIVAYQTARHLNSDKFNANNEDEDEE
jgi:hypothetical protein